MKHGQVDFQGRRSEIYYFTVNSLEYVAAVEIIELNDK